MSLRSPDIHDRIVAAIRFDQRVQTVLAAADYSAQIEQQAYASTLNDFQKARLARNYAIREVVTEDWIAEHSKIFPFFRKGMRAQ